MENVDVHIWELPEKTDEIDKSNDYTLIHDGGALKKINIEKLYEYFGQDYKIENTVKYFETIMELENKRYDTLYSELESSTDISSEAIKDLSDGFTDNANRIRVLETSSNQIQTDINTISEAFKNIRSRDSILHNNLSVLQDDIIKIESVNTVLDDIVIVNVTAASNLQGIITKINANNNSINKIINRLPNNIDAKIDEKGEVLLKNINDAYDRIISIIDYYHHETH